MDTSGELSSNESSLDYNDVIPFDIKQLNKYLDEKACKNTRETINSSSNQLDLRSPYQIHIDEPLAERFTTDSMEEVNVENFVLNRFL